MGKFHGQAMYERELLGLIEVDDHVSPSPMMLFWETSLSLLKVG